MKTIKNKMIFGLVLMLAAVAVGSVRGSIVQKAAKTVIQHYKAVPYVPGARNLPGRENLGFTRGEIGLPLKVEGGAMPSRSAGVSSYATPAQYVQPERVDAMDIPQQEYQSMRPQVTGGVGGMQKQVGQESPDVWERQAELGEPVYEPSGVGASAGVSMRPEEESGIPSVGQSASRISEKTLFTEIHESEVYKEWLQENKGFDPERDPELTTRAFVQDLIKKAKEKEILAQEVEQLKATKSPVVTVEKEIVSAPQAKEGVGETVERVERAREEIKARQQKEREERAALEAHLKNLEAAAKERDAIIAELQNRLTQIRKPAAPDTAGKEIQSRPVDEVSAKRIAELEGQVNALKTATEKAAAERVVGEALQVAEAREKFEADLKAKSDAAAEKEKDLTNTIDLLTKENTALKAAAQKEAEKSIKGVVGGAIEGAQAKAADAEIKTVQDTLAARTKELKDTKATVEAVTIELKAAQQDANTSKGLAETQKTQIEALAAQVNELTSKVKDAQEALIKAQNEARSQDEARVEQVKKDQAVEQARAKATQDFVQQIDELKARLAEQEKVGQEHVKQIELERDTIKGERDQKDIALNKAKVQVGDLEAAVKLKEEEITNVQNKVTRESTDALNKLKEEFAQKEKVLENEADALRQEKTKADGDVVRLNQELSNARDKAVSLENAVKKASGENAELQKKLSTDLEEFNKQLEQKEVDVTQIRTELETARKNFAAEKEALQKNISDTQARAEQASNDLAAERRAMDKLKSDQAAALNSVQLEAQAKIKEAGEKTQASAQALEEFKKNAQQELETAKRDAQAQLKTMQEKYAGDLASVQEDFEAKLADAEKAAQAKIEALKREQKTALEQQAELNKNELANQAANNEAALNAVRSDLEAAQKKSAGLEAANNDLAKQKTQLDVTHGNQMAEFMRQMDAMKEGHKAELEEAQKANDAFEKENSGLKKNNADLQQENKNLSEKIDGLTKDIKKLVEEKSGIETINNDLKTANDALGKTNAELSATNVELNKQNEALGKQNDALGKENERVKTENKESKEEAQRRKKKESEDAGRPRGVSPSSRASGDSGPLRRRETVVPFDYGSEEPVAPEQIRYIEQPSPVAPVQPVTQPTQSQGTGAPAQPTVIPATGGESTTPRKQSPGSSSYGQPEAPRYRGTAEPRSEFPIEPWPYESLGTPSSLLPEEEVAPELPGASEGFSELIDGDGSEIDEGIEGGGESEDTTKLEVPTQKKIGKDKPEEKTPEKTEAGEKESLEEKIIEGSQEGKEPVVEEGV